VTPRSRPGFLLLALACLPVAGCTNSSSSPSPFLAFTPGPAPTIYAGTIADSTKGNGTLKVSLTGAGGLISGNWDMSFGGKADPTYVISGPDSGSTTYTATVTTCVDTGLGENCRSNCEFRFTGSLTGSSLSGTYAATSDQSCLGRTGTVNTTKQ
jgi:hypothetical protein